MKTKVYDNGRWTNWLFLMFLLAFVGSILPLGPGDSPPSLSLAKTNPLGGQTQNAAAPVQSEGLHGADGGSSVYPAAADVTEQVSELEQIQQMYESMEVVATGYYAGRESTGKDPGHPQYGITYSGIEVRRDPNSVSTIAADLNTFPLGTLLYIPGYGYGIVTDIGGAIQGNKIDLYFHTKDDVYNKWGKKTLDVYIIKRGDGKVTEEMMLDLSETYKG